MTTKINFCLLIFFLLNLTVNAQQFRKALNVDFQNGLIYTQVPTSAGPLNMLANTSGGAYVLETAVNDYGLSSIKDQEGQKFVQLDQILEQAGWPTLNRNSTLVIDDNEASLPEGIHGELGQSWFGQYSWQFDYENKELVCNPYNLTAGTENTVSVLFRESDEGARMSNLPVVFASVEGVDIPFILDTGAKMHPTDEASAALGTAPEEPVATSFIIEFIFDHWRTIHPEWRVVETADANMGNVRMIEVPEISIAGQMVGPVWFCTRPDINYLEYMARFTQIPAMGSLGGNFLSQFNLTIDYPNKLAQFGLPNPE
jgi:hypothetical protein